MTTGDYQPQPGPYGEPAGYPPPSGRQPGGLGVRFAARLIDGIIVNVVAFIIAFAIGSVSNYWVTGLFSGLLMSRRLATGLPVGERNPVWRILHTPDQGARASLQAVITDLPSGTYLAPRFNQWGRPSVTGLRKKARDPVAARRLWALSAELTGCDWPAPRS